MNTLMHVMTIMHNSRKAGKDSPFLMFGEENAHEKEELPSEDCFVDADLNEPYLHQLSAALGTKELKLQKETAEIRAVM